MNYKQSVHAKEKYCPMAGGSMEALVHDLQANLLGKKIRFYPYAGEELRLLSNLPYRGVKGQLKKAARKIKDFRKKDSVKSSDFRLDISIDEYGADLKGFGPKEFDTVYETILNTVKHD
jgi:hypothetical protein